MTARDENSIPVMFGVSHLDGVTPVAITFTGRRMGVDSSTTIAFTPSVKTLDQSLLKATSSADDATILPIVVHATTGKVLISP